MFALRHSKDGPAAASGSAAVVDGPLKLQTVQQALKTTPEQHEVGEGESSDRHQVC